ncbi:transposase for insertion sequence element IS231E [Bacillus cereus BAG2X1-1]|nr:transposase for insertion sequence element IS231E [Bacillus cereus BAG2X1-1]
MDTLKPGQSYEIKEAYIGKDKKLFTRVIMYRLTEKQLRERMKKQVYTESKKGITY